MPVLAKYLRQLPPGKILYKALAIELNYELDSAEYWYLRT
jgi:hypothetical protein